MTALLTRYLWKEWRDQRTALVGLGVLLTVLALVAGFALPERYAGDSLFVHTAVVVAAVAFAMSAGGDLFPGERERGTLVFLERLPAGLHTAFWAKGIVYLAGAVASVGLGLGLSLAVALVRTDNAAHLLGNVEPGLLAMVAFGLLWLPAVSAWLTRGAPAVLTVPVVLGVFLWPLWVWGFEPIRWYRESDAEFVLLLVLGALAGPVAAWTSFAWGLRFGRGALGSSFFGLSTLVAFLLPSWAWTGAGMLRAYTLDPVEKDVDLLLGYVSRGGGNAFFHGDVDGRSVVIQVDLETASHRWWYGSLQADGEAMDRVERVWIDDRCYDADTLKAVAGKARPAAAFPGRPSAAQLGFDGGDAIQRGLGYLVGRYHWDPSRNRSYELEFPAGFVWIRPGDWVRLNSRRGWFLYDPDTEESRPWADLTVDDWVGRVLPDGRLWVRDSQGMALRRPETGERTPLARTDWDQEVSHFFTPVFQADSGGGLLARAWGPVWAGLIRLDLESLTLTRTEGSIDRCQILNIGEGDDVLVLEGGKRVVRLAFGSAKREVIWPRE